MAERTLFEMLLMIIVVALFSITSLNDKYAMWGFVSEDKKEVLVHGVIFRTEPNRTQYLAKLRGLLPDTNYRLAENGEVYKGSALMNGGILLPKSWGDYASIEMHFISEA